MKLKEWANIHPKRKFYSELILWLIMVAVLIYDLNNVSSDGEPRNSLLMLFAALGWLLPVFRLWQWWKYNENTK
jgi:hypothetical protein